MNFSHCECKLYGGWCTEKKKREKKREREREKKKEREKKRGKKKKGKKEKKILALSGCFSHTNERFLFNITMDRRYDSSQHLPYLIVNFLITCKGKGKRNGTFHFFDRNNKAVF